MLKYVYFIFFFSLNFLSYGFSLKYTLTTRSGDLWNTYWEFTTTGDYLKMVSEDRSGKRIFFTDKSGSVSEFHYIDNDQNTYFYGKKNNRVIELSQIIRKQQKIKHVEVNTEYWYQPIGHCFFDFVFSEETSREFFIINPENLRPVSFTIRKKHTEFIILNSKHIKAIYAELKANGLLSPFWCGKYWLCPETGIILRYKGTFGPGTPVTEMELSEVTGIIQRLP